MKIIVPLVLPKDDEMFIWTSPTHFGTGYVDCRIYNDRRVLPTDEDLRLTIDIFRDKGLAILFSVHLEVIPMSKKHCSIVLNFVPVNFWEEVTHKLHIIPGEQMSEDLSARCTIVTFTGYGKEDMAVMFEPIE